jgi:hypothetical protein
MLSGYSFLGEADHNGRMIYPAILRKSECVEPPMEADANTIRQSMI